jgi:serine phosphatase RsbU (regulator of sigma subunit)
VVRVGRPRAPLPSDQVEIGAISIPYPGEEQSGDAWGHDAARSRLMVADGLGHGVFAAEASAAALQFLDDANSPDPLAAIGNAHLKLRSTRGAAMAVADLDLSAGFVTFAGVGNVAGSIVAGPQLRRQMVSINGTLGHEMGNARQYRYPLEPGALIILHSDGLSTHWSLDKYPGLFQRHPSVVAGVLFRDSRRVRDDVTVVVARVRSGDG